MIKVYQYDNNGDYITYHDSIQAAADSISIDEALMRYVIKKQINKNGYYWSKEQKVNLFSNPPQSIKEYFPRILVLDIETAPLLSWTWGIWNQNINLSQLISTFFILTWSAKWLDDKEIYSEKLTEEEVYCEDDRRIMKKLWKLLDDADIIIAHNGDQFDIPKINTRFLLNKIPTPSIYKQIDTKKIAKKHFGFVSNKLQHLATQLGIEGKYDTGMELWKKCMKGDEEALKHMERYNRHDVEILEKVYLKLRPYTTSHPNMDIYYDDVEMHCTHCGSTNLVIEIDKKYYTNSNIYQLYRCKDCEGLSRAKKADKLINKKQISVIPR